MSGFIPSTDDVLYLFGKGNDSVPWASEASFDRFVADGGNEGEFNRWLDEIKRKARKQGWAEGHTAGLEERVAESVTDDERGKVAAEVIDFILSEMDVNNAYEYDGKPIYDGLTCGHIDYVLAEFRGEHKRGAKQ